MTCTGMHEWKGQRGFSFLELLTVAAIMMALVYGVAVLSITGQRANRHVARATRAMELNQEVLDAIGNDLESAIEVFGNDARGQGFLALMSTVGMPAVLPDSRLPTPTTDGQLAVDTTGNEITGNQLAISRLAWADEFTCTSGNTHRVDVMRWIHYHLADVSSRGFELVRWVSEPLADGAQIAAIPDAADREEFCEHLRDATADDFGRINAACVVVWDRREDPVTGSPFQQILSDGTLDPLPEAVTNRTPPDWVVLSDPTYPDVGFFIRRQFAVVPNDAPGVMLAGSHAIVDTSGGGFPHGFEVQVVGPTSARVVMLRLAIFSRLQDDLAAWSSLKSLVHLREQ